MPPAGRPGLVVVRGGALGDVLLGVPALRALRRRFPEQPLHLVAPQPQAGFLRSLGLAESALAVDDPALTPLVPGGASPRPSPGAAAPGFPGGGLAARGRPARQQPGPRRGPGGALRPGPARTKGAPYTPPTGCCRRWRPWGSPPRRTGTRSPWLTVPPEAPAWAAGWRREALSEGPYLVLHPGSGGARKNWPGAEWAAAVREVSASDPVGPGRGRRSGGRRPPGDPPGRPRPAGGGAGPPGRRLPPPGPGAAGRCPGAGVPLPGQRLGRDPPRGRPGAPDCGRLRRPPTPPSGALAGLGCASSGGRGSWPAGPEVTVAAAR